jgi:hypothetical protein
MAGITMPPSAPPAGPGASTEGTGADGQLPAGKDLSVAVFDRPDFNTVDFINQIFPNGNSCSTISTILVVRSIIGHVD